MLTTTAKASNITTPRAKPKAPPRIRSTGRNPTDATSFLTNHASNPPANATAMNTNRNPAASCSGGDRPSSGNITATSSA